MEVVDPSYFGQASFEKPETIEIASPGDSATKITTQCSQGQWRPPARLASFLPLEFVVPLRLLHRLGWRPAGSYPAALSRS